MQRERPDKIGKILVDLGFVAMRDVLAALSAQLSVPLVTIDGPPPASPETEGLAAALHAAVPFPARGDPGLHADHRHGRSAGFRDALRGEGLHGPEGAAGAGGRAGDPGRHRQVLRRRGEGGRGAARRPGRIERELRAPARHGQRGAGHPAGECHDRPGRGEARQRHSHRAFRKGIPGPLPRGRSPVQPGVAAAGIESGDHLAGEADGEAQHRRAAPAAGRAHQDQDPGPRDRSARFHAPHALRRERGHAPPGPVGGRLLRSSKAGLRRPHAGPHGAFHRACRTASFW